MSSAEDNHSRADVLRYAALALICLAPVVIVPGGENRFVFGKVFLVAVGVALAASLPARGRLERPAAIALVCGLAILVLAALASAAPWVAFVGRAPRFEGLPMIGLYAGSAWAGARLLGPRPPEDQTRVVILMVAVTACAVALVAIVQVSGVQVLATNVFRPGSLLGNADDEGALGVLAFGVCGWAAARSLAPAAVIGAVSACVVVALSASRAALLGLVVTALIVLWGSPRRRVVLVVGGVLMVVVLMLAVPSTRARVTGSSPYAGVTATGRVLLWQESAALIGHHPVLGVGPDNFIDAITAEHDVRWQSEIGPANPPDSPQNTLLQAGVDGGLPLLLVALVLAALVLRGGWRAMRPGSARAGSLAIGLFAAVAGYGVTLLFGLTTPGTTPLAALCAGGLLAVAGPRAAASGRDSSDPLSHIASEAILRWSIVTACSVIALAAFLAAAAEVPLERGLVAVSHGDIAAAQGDFHDAQALRSWDVSVAQTAGHAFAAEGSELTAGSSAGVAVAHAGQPWLAETASHLADNEEERLDEATIDELLGRNAAAESLLRRALAVDPDDPAVLLRLGVVEGEAHQLSLAQSTLVRITRIDPNSAAVWNDLAIVYGLKHNSLAQARAEARAKQLQ
jgi:hypothetical protein